MRIVFFPHEVFLYPRAELETTIDRSKEIKENETEPENLDACFVYYLSPFAKVSCIKRKSGTILSLHPILRCSLGPFKRYHTQNEGRGLMKKVTKSDAGEEV